MNTNLYLKYLFEKRKNHAGRNNKGRITSAHRGGKNKTFYRKINFLKYYNNNSIIIKKIYDPNRNTKILAIKNKNNYQFIPNIKGLKTGDIINTKLNTTKSKIGFCDIIKNIAINTKICCIESTPNKGAVFSRSAGNYSIIINHLKNYTLIKLSSKKTIKLKNTCKAIIGEIGDNEKEKKIKKAGNNRHLGIRPHVRGVAKNPVDHPHGGGEGKTGTKRQSVNKLGHCKRGKKTAKIK